MENSQQDLKILLCPHWLGIESGKDAGHTRRVIIECVRVRVRTLRKSFTEHAGGGAGPEQWQLKHLADLG